MSKEEIMAAIRECTATQGHVPTYAELNAKMKIGMRAIRMHFGSYAEALRACGLEKYGTGYGLTAKVLFIDWAELARKLGRVPTITEYERQGKYSVSAMTRRFGGGWKQVPQRTCEFAIKEGLKDEWEDVLRLVSLDQELRKMTGRKANPSTTSAFKPKPIAGRTTYGAPLMHDVMCHAPTNESGIIFLFGALARELGFKVLHIQTGFPDCEAMCEVEPGRWQRIRIEFEYESRNFLEHSHKVEHCDLIVCWRHNWEDCPMEVIELSRVELGRSGEPPTARVIAGNRTD
jgi:hypothetical protein